MFQKEELSIGNWLGFMFLMLIPVVNFIVFIVVLSSPNTNRTLKNYLIAQIVFITIIAVVYIVLLSQFISLIQNYFPAI